MLPEPFASWFHFLVILLRDNDEKALFLLLLVEEAGVPMPMPGDIVIAFVGYRASMGEMTVIEAAVSVVLAVLLGSTILYTLSRKLGRGLLFRYGRLVHLDEGKLRKIERWIQKRGPVMVLVGRLTPGLRTPTSIMAGVFEIPLHQFLFFAGLSALIWSFFWLGLGYYSGHSVLPLLRRYTHYSAYLLVVLLLALAVALLAHRRYGFPWRTKGENGSRASEVGPSDAQLRASNETQPPVGVGNAAESDG